MIQNMRHTLEWDNIPTKDISTFDVVEGKLDISGDYFDLGRDIGDSTVCFNMHYGGKKYRIGNYGHLGFIAGASGSMKSIMALSLVEAALTGKQVLNYTIDLQGGDILYCDTELPDDVLKDRQAGMLMRAGYTSVPSNYRCLSVSGYPDPIEKKSRIMRAIEDNPNIKFLVLDMVVDMMPSESDVEMANVITNDLVSLAKSRDMMIICISHVNSEGGLLNHAGKKIFRKSSWGVNLKKHNNKVFISMSKVRYEPVPMTNFTFKDNVPVPGNYIPFSKIKID